MTKQGEIEYLKNIGEEGIWHAVNKPFSDGFCHGYLFQIGAVMALLPPTPAKLLDIGCGTGWTSIFFAKRGYEVTGIDISPDMIYHANLQKGKEKIDRSRFLVHDFESADFNDEFDCAVFFDSLHHAMNEEAAIYMAYRALKYEGICIASEPGQGHAKSPIAIEQVNKYNVTEKDMPPGKIIALGRKAGFRKFEVYPHAFDLCNLIYVQPRGEAHNELATRKSVLDIRESFRRLHIFDIIGSLKAIIAHGYRLQMGELRNPPRVWDTRMSRDTLAKLDNLSHIIRSNGITLMIK
jgi:SAM-dependent methyltransferase